MKLVTTPHVPTAKKDHRQEGLAEKRGSWSIPDPPQPVEHIDLATRLSGNTLETPADRAPRHATRVSSATAVLEQ